MPKSAGKSATYLFIIGLCFAAALLLSSVSLLLGNRQEKERMGYRNKQLLMCSQILNANGEFQILLPNNTFQKAKYHSQVLIPADHPPKATKQEIAEICDIRLVPLLTNNKGEIFTFEQAKLSMATYLTKHEKDGYYNLRYKLFYKILGNTKKDKVYGYIFPVNGYGLWDAIYGLLALFPDGNTILGISWYEQKETPGLGAEISTHWWQKQFFRKTLFKPSSDGSINYKKAPMGIDIVSQGEMKRLSPIRQSHAVDGVTGATMTMHGVQQALKDSMEAYRPLLLKLQEAHE